MGLIQAISCQLLPGSLLSFFALDGPYLRLSLDSLNSTNGQLLAVFHLIQPGIAKTHIFHLLSARSLSLFTVFGLS